VKYPVKISSCIFFSKIKIIIINQFFFFFFSSEYKNCKDDPLIEQIKKSIEILYKKYFTSDDIDISTIHMLQIIENKIKSLFNLIENMNSSFIIEAEKVFIFSENIKKTLLDLFQSRELTIRKIEQQEKFQQEKLIKDLKYQKALLRSSSPPYKKVYKSPLNLTGGRKFFGQMFAHFSIT
jgi:hypothetical protein